MYTKPRVQSPAVHRTEPQPQKLGENKTAKVEGNLVAGSAWEGPSPGLREKVFRDATRKTAQGSQLTCCGITCAAQRELSLKGATEQQDTHPCGIPVVSGLLEEVMPVGRPA